MNKQAIENIPSAREISELNGESTHEMKLPSVSPSDIPTVSADITDHEVSQGFRSTNLWPVGNAGGNKHHELLVHFHFCELLHAWNLNPFKRDAGVASIDEYAESMGISRFAFTTHESRSDFLDFYGLDDFIVNLVDPKSPEDAIHKADPYFYLTLTNKFHPNDVRKFLDVYKLAMNTLAVIHDERERAIRNDGNKVGFITADHFNARESAELIRIKRAREQLGAPGE